MLSATGLFSTDVKSVLPALRPTAKNAALRKSVEKTCKIILFSHHLQTEKYYLSWLMLNAVDKSDDH